MKKFILLFVIVFFVLSVSANECTDKKGICYFGTGCPEGYSVSTFSCAPAVSPFCCIPSGVFTCEKTEGYFCSTEKFVENSDYLGMNEYPGIPADKGLELSDLICPYEFNCYKKIFNVHRGEGKFTLQPGDEIILLDERRIKYTNFQENVRGINRDGKTFIRNSASISLYDGEINPLNYEENWIASLVDADDISTEGWPTTRFGVYAKVEPLKKDSKLIEIEVLSGVSISVCTDTDTYKPGDISTGGSTTYGRNYFLKGITSEIVEDKGGQHSSMQEDSCVEGVLTEYYCSDNRLVSEQRKCTCADEWSCEKGLLDVISEWFSKTFGNLN